MNRIARIAAAVTATTPLLARVALQAGTTVAAYLRANGVAATWITQWGSAFGRRAANAYRKATGAEPRKIREGARDVFAYDGTAHLDEALAHYRTHKTAGPQLAAGYDRARAAAKQPRDSKGRFTRLFTVVWSTPAGRETRRGLTADAVRALLRTVAHHHRVTELAVRDARGRTATDFALAA